MEISSKSQPSTDPRKRTTISLPAPKAKEEGELNLNLTSLLCNAGARTFEKAMEELIQADRKEIDNITNGTNELIKVEDDEEEEEEEEDITMEDNEVNNNLGLGHFNSSSSASNSNSNSNTRTTTITNRIEEGASSSTIISLEGGEIEEGSSSNNTNENEEDEKLTNSSQYLKRIWSTLSPKHPPNFSLLLDPINKTYGCTISIFIPPSYNSNYTLPPSSNSNGCLTKKEAKDSVARMAMKFGEIEKGRKFLDSLDRGGEFNSSYEMGTNGGSSGARGGGGGKEQGWELGDKKAEDWEKGWETVENPVGIVSEAYKHFGLGDIKFEFQTGKGGELESANLILPLTRTTSKIISSEGIFINRQDVKNYLARQVLKSDLLKIVTKEAKIQLELDTGGYINLKENFLDGNKEYLINPSLHLQKELERVLGGVRFNKISPYRKVPGQGDEETSYTGSLEISIPRTSFVRKFTSPENARSPMEIKRVLSCIAFKAGIIEELEDLKSMNGGNFNEIVPKLGSIREDEFSSMKRPTTYLSNCLSQMTRIQTPLKFEIFVDENRQYTCEITATLTSSPLTSKSYKTPNSYPTQALAKESATRLALQSGILTPAKEGNPFWSAPPASNVGGGFNGQRGGMNGRGGSRGNDRGGSNRGGSGRGGYDNNRGNYGNGQGNHGGRPPYPSSNDRDNRNGNMNRNGGDQNGWRDLGRQISRGGSMDNGSTPYNRELPYPPSNQYRQPPPPPPPSQQQQSYYSEQDRYSQGAYPRQSLGPHSSYGGGSSSNVVPPTARNLTAVEQIDQFCQTMLGRLPIYEPHQDLRSNLYGSVIRIPISPIVEKTFWVQQDYPRRFDAEEAVARLALDQGIREIVRLELGYPPAVAFPQAPPPASRDQYRGGSIGSQDPYSQRNNSQAQSMDRRQSSSSATSAMNSSGQNRFSPYPSQQQSNNHPRSNSTSSHSTSSEVRRPSRTPLPPQRAISPEATRGGRYSQGNGSSRGGRGGFNAQEDRNALNSSRGKEQFAQKVDKMLEDAISAPVISKNEIKIDEKDSKEKIVQEKPVVVPTTTTPIAPKPTFVNPPPPPPPPPPPAAILPTVSTPVSTLAKSAKATSQIESLNNFCLSNNMEAANFIEDPVNPKGLIHAVIARLKFELPLSPKNLALTPLQQKESLSIKILKYLEKQKSLGLLHSDP